MARKELENMFNALSDSSNGIHSFLKEYIGKCKSGEIIVGHELIQMLDILQSHFGNPDIRFELEDPHKRIKFIETHCKHFEAPFAGKPFILELFQKAVAEAIYGFKIFDEEAGRWIRLYQDILYVVGRKNGKTPFVSALILAEFFCGPKGCKVLCASNDDQQADLMFQAINSMREESKSLERKTRKNLTGIYFGNPRKPIKTGKFSYQNKGSIRKLTARTGSKEGRNIAVGAVDEVHEMKNNELVMPIQQALSTQEEPLYFELTTEGFTNDGYLDKRMKEARSVLAGEAEQPRWLIWIYTQDNEAEVWQNEQSWHKSNPGLGVIKKWSYLRKWVDLAKTNTETRAFVLAKDFNLKQNTAAAWLMENEYMNLDIFNPEDFRGHFGMAGVDLAETTDLASAKIMLMRKGSAKKYFLSKYFIPEAKLKAKEKDEGSDYQKWVADGLVEVSPGNENDFSLITKWFIRIYKQFGIRPYKVGYDNALAKYWAKEMEDMGFDLERIPQERHHMSSPMKLLGQDLRGGLVNYNANPVDMWCLGNMGFSVDSREFIMPVKIKTDKRIDGGVAKIIAYATYTRYRNDFINLLK
ncbi:phage terminase [Desulfosporosinus acididurans]|uniref:Phage terminase n=1 Tax=Desulfosporosinus acididurans TaxID=476652 RepID=A0A0J1FTX4_9FIRM|nr:terminase TerL endonuclease subunit [Desulfosporosinus acididurans]KLU66747.1 phage terminase [Desulfosporosinus acididurans]